MRCIWIAVLFSMATHASAERHAYWPLKDCFVGGLDETAVLWGETPPRPHVLATDERTRIICSQSGPSEITFVWPLFNDEGLVSQSRETQSVYGTTIDVIDGEILLRLVIDPAEPCALTYFTHAKLDGLTCVFD